MSVGADPSTSSNPSMTRAALGRATGLTALLAVEFMSLVKAYRAQALPGATLSPAWIDLNAAVMKSAFLFLNVGAVILVALVLVNWTQRRTMIAAWAEAVRSRAWRPWIFANLAIFAVTLVGAFALNAQLARAGSPPWFEFGLWCACAALLVPTLALAFAPVRYWMHLALSQRVAIVLAVAVAAFASLFMLVSERLW